MKNNFLKYKFYQTGQTLIETLVACFMLVMGITAAVGLAIYAFNSSTSVTKQIIATGLAREGVEAVKNMRDTNWLQDTLEATCYDYTSNPVGQSTANCYKNWLGKNGAGGPPFCINPSSGNSCNGNDITDSYYLDRDYSSSDYWILTKESSDFGLNFNSSSFDNGFYTPSGTQNGTSDYYRQIVLTKDDSGQFDKDEFNKLKVDVRVWWVDKKCPRVPSYTSGMKCSVSIQTSLTNWKDY